MTEKHIEKFLISGCSGGGKSTLLAALSELGFATVPEPGRRIVAKERERGGAALPWIDPMAFAQRAVDLSLSDLAGVEGNSGPVFFDRGLIDAVVALEHAGGPSIQAQLSDRCPYAKTVLIAPPWPEIFASDAERRHGFEDARAEYDRLLIAFDALGYETLDLPRVPVPERVAFVLNALSLR